MSNASVQLLYISRLKSHCAESLNPAQSLYLCISPRICAPMHDSSIYCDIHVGIHARKQPTPGPIFYRMVFGLAIIYILDTCIQGAKSKGSSLPANLRRIWETPSLAVTDIYSIPFNESINFNYSNIEVTVNSR